MSVLEDYPPREFADISTEQLQRVRRGAQLVEPEVGVRLIER